jgi:hypothetical protein
LSFNTQPIAISSMRPYLTAHTSVALYIYTAAGGHNARSGKPNDTCLMGDATCER